MRLSLFFLFVLAASSGAAITAELEVRDMYVSRIVDGDTVIAVDAAHMEHRLRLAGIDAPEKAQPFSERSKKNLGELIAQKSVRVSWSKVDNFGRLVAVISPIREGVCRDPFCQSSEDANLLQIRAGLAWHFKKYQREQSASDRLRYAAAEKQARESKVGLWEIHRQWLHGIGVTDRGTAR